MQGLARFLCGSESYASVNWRPASLPNEGELQRIKFNQHDYWKSRPLIINGVPTGVEVCPAMQHGGPPTLPHGCQGSRPSAPMPLSGLFGLFLLQNFPDTFARRIERIQSLEDWRYRNSDWVKVMLESAAMKINKQFPSQSPVSSFQLPVTSFHQFMTKTFKIFSALIIICFLIARALMSWHKWRSLSSHQFPVTSHQYPSVYDKGTLDFLHANIYCHLIGTCFPWPRAGGGHSKKGFAVYII